MHSSTKADIPRWFLALVQVTGQRPSPIPNTGHGKGASDGGLFLDFLCPQQSPSRMGSSLPRPQKKLAARRRRPNAGFLRSYTSASGTEQAISMEDTAADQTEQHSEESLEPQYSSRNEDPTLEDRTLEDRTLEDPMLEDPTFEDPTLEELHWTLQDPTSDHFDKVWDLYLEAGSPPEYNSEVLYYLSRSPNSQHQEWAWIVFQNIPHSERTNRNYGHIIGSQYLSEPPWVAPHVISICKQALSTPLAGPCIVWNLLYAAKSGNWSQISEIWSLTSEIESDPALHLTVLDAFKKNSFLAKGLLGLVEYLELEKGDQRLLALARLFFDQVLADNSLLSAVTTSDLLQVLEKYRHIRSLEESDYIEVIARLNTSDAWPESVRSIFFYRQFRLEIPNWHPPKKLLTCLFDRAVAFEMLDSILYLLEELAHFEKKPSIAAYREALQAFSKAGDVHKVHYIFDRLVADYGNPKSRRLLSPLLVVHAQVGDVYETQRHFDRISAEFGLRPNTICWNILIQTYVAAGDASGAASVLTRMLNQNETPSSHTYGTIMGLFARRNDLLNVRQLFYQAKSSNVEITLPMARMLLQAYLKNDDYEQAEKLIFDYWQSVSGATPMALFNTRLRHHASRVEKRYFTRILGAADALGLEPDAGTYAAIMYAHVITRQSGEARTVLLKMVAAGIEPTEVHYSLLMLAYLSHGNHNMVNATFREMQARLGKGRKDARIVYLKTQLERDIWNAKMTDTLAEDVSFPYSEEALRASTNVDSDPTPPKILPLHASGSPEPHALTLHYHNMIKAYGSVSTVEKTHEALDHYLQSRPSTISRDQKMAELPFDLIKYLMLAHLKVEEFTVVEQYWNNLWPRIISFATRVDPDQFFSADSARAGREAAERAAIEDAEAAAKRVADLEIAVVQEYNKFEELNFTPGNF
ncbi:uncharacterized protein N7511_006729 [Penicillium nucicola]|uniref:uncharacterized protein n=1 Tax=Penicillium nucicola TaxID=1850975 RepID=UPI002544E1DF|nr:uncharacterized protein N7511_006729 [Penicillium nucicola]KAJ5758035.1 hypothetical protein N7511_006729 [Penicillium nucicola]